MRRGFLAAVAVTPAGGWGKGAECPRATVAERDLEKGEGALSACRGERGARGRAEGRGYRPRRGGWAERSWSRRVYISARVTSAEKRTELTRLIPPGGQGGGPAPEEARPGRVCVGRESAAGAGAGRELGAGPGRLRPLWVAGLRGGAGHQFPSLSCLIAAAYLSFLALLACTTGCTRPFFYSRSPRRHPAAISPCSPAGREAWLRSESVS